MLKLKEVKNYLEVCEVKIFKLLFVILFVAITFVVGQNYSNELEVNADDIKGEDIGTKAEKIPAIQVTLKNTEDVTIGNATLTEKGDGVEIKVEAHNLSPGLHGFHIHENGICEPPDFESAGGHFNPTDKEHGFKNKLGPHAGDLKNLKVEEDGTVNQTFFNDRVTLKQGEPNSLLQGTSLIIHQDKDDYISQPSGNSGDRIACGVISSDN